MMHPTMLIEIQKELAALRAASGTAARIDLGALGLWLLCAPFYAAGWLGGFVVRCALWTMAALVAGYKAGRQ